MTTKTLKFAKTIKEYRVHFKGWDVIVPVGSLVCNKTAGGLDDSYRFWRDFTATAEKLTGVKCSILWHDLTYYGINIPAEYCEPWTEKESYKIHG